MKKLILPVLFLLPCFNVYSAKNTEHRVMKISKAVTKQIWSEFNHIYSAMAIAEVCEMDNKKNDMLMKEKKLMQDRLHALVKSKIPEICISKDTCRSDLQMVVDIVGVSQGSFSAGRLSILRELNLTSQYCESNGTNIKKHLKTTTIN